MGTYISCHDCQIRYVGLGKIYTSQDTNNDECFAFSEFVRITEFLQTHRGHHLEVISDHEEVYAEDGVSRDKVFSSYDETNRSMKIRGKIVQIFGVGILLQILGFSLCKIAFYPGTILFFVGIGVVFYVLSLINKTPR